jgi:[protein-PII] uridylyltransferase
VWDSGVGLDHAVRTVDEPLGGRRDDLKAALGPARRAAPRRGRRAVGRAAQPHARRLAARQRRRLPELRAAVVARARTEGEVAFLLEPDLKSARGGLRDVHALHALAAAQVADPPSREVRARATLLLDVRGELHRRTAGPAVGSSTACCCRSRTRSPPRWGRRTPTRSWRRSPPPPAPSPTPATRPGAASVRRRAQPARPAHPGASRAAPLADDVVEQDGEVVLARDAAPADDPVLVLRVAAAAARADLPVAPHTLSRLVEQCPDLPVPWPPRALEALVQLLAAGPPAVAAFEALDQVGLLTRLLPEWQSVRSKPQRNSYHRFTVDRHLVETAAAAAALTRRVARPDLLLLGALLHDIGKGLPGDHTEVGMRVVAGLAPRLGLPPADVEVLVALVEHHLLLPDVADPPRPLRPRDRPRRSPTPWAAPRCSSCCTRSPRPTRRPPVRRPGRPGRPGLVAELVRGRPRCWAGPPRRRPRRWPAPGRWSRGGPLLEALDDEVTASSPGPARAAVAVTGVLALHRLDVRSASVSPAGDRRSRSAGWRPASARCPTGRSCAATCCGRLDGELDLEQVLASRESAYAPPGRRGARPRRRPELLDDALRHGHGPGGPRAGRARRPAPHDRRARALRARRPHGAHHDARRRRGRRLLPRGDRTAAR